MGYWRLVRLYNWSSQFNVNSRLPGPNAKPEILKGGVVYADSAMCSSPEQTKIPKDRQFGAKSSHVRQRYIRTAADNQMIKHAYLHESTTFYHPFGNQSVGLTWLRATGGMIMRKDHGGGVHFDGFAYNFSRMHLNVAKSTRKRRLCFNTRF